MKYIILQILLVLALALVVVGIIMLFWMMTRKRNGLKFERILRGEFHIPIEDGTLVRTENVYAAKRAIKKLLKAKANLEAAPVDEEYKRAYFDIKLKSFHLYSLLGCYDDKVIGDLVDKAKKAGKTLPYNELRVDPEEKEITVGAKTVLEQNCEAALDEMDRLKSRIESIFDNATIISNKKTKNLWGRESGRKNRKVRNELLEILKALKNETEVIDQILARIEGIISVARLSFFRNQYLCSELMEYCQIDSVKMKIFPEIHLIRSRPILLQQYEGNEDSHEVDIQISAFNISCSLWLGKCGAEEVEALKSEAKDILKAIEETEEDLRKRHDAVIRTINITTSLIALNKRFVIQYIPLRTKVFIHGENATSLELQTLAQTVSQFNRYFERE